jgi:PhnB protein
MELAPYLNFDGSCREAFGFYADLLGGTIAFMQTFGESPVDAPPGWHDKVMHATLTLGADRLMGSDAPPQHYHRPQGTYVSLQLKTRQDGERIFKAFADGGTVEMPFTETFWSPGFGMVVDRFGIPWMVNVEAQPA